NAEREHGQLVHLGDTRGVPAAARDELQGRPTRDGKYVLLAGIVDAQAGRLYLAVGDPVSRQNRFTRELDLGRPVQSVALLDSDLRGTIYLAAAEPGGLVLFCLSGETGDLHGGVPVPASPGADETCLV